MMSRTKCTPTQQMRRAGILAAIAGIVGWVEISRASDYTLVACICPGVLLGNKSDLELLRAALQDWKDPDPKRRSHQQLVQRWLGERRVERARAELFRGSGGPRRLGLELEFDC